MGFWSFTINKGAVSAAEIFNIGWIKNSDDFGMMVAHGRIINMQEVIMIPANTKRSLFQLNFFDFETAHVDGDFCHDFARVCFRFRQLLLSICQYLRER